MEKLKFTSWAEWEAEHEIKLREQEERDRADPVRARMAATVDSFIEASRISNIKWAEEYDAEHAEEFASQALAEAQRIVTEHLNAVSKAKAAEEFGVLVEVVEEFCKEGQIAACNSQELAEDVQEAFNAFLGTKGMPPVGIKKLQRALGKVGNGQK
jgi:hypothetical protein